MSISIHFLNKKSQKVRSISSTIHTSYYVIKMSTYNIQQKISENTKTKLGVISLAALPVVAAMYSSGSMALEQVPQILTSGYFQSDLLSSLGQ